MTTQMSPGREPMTVDEPQDTTTGWVGWIFFASVMMIIAGSLNAFHGLVAIVNDEWVVWATAPTSTST